MNNLKEFNNILLKSFESMIDKKLSNIYYDKTFPSIIYGKNGDGTYQIVREGVIYNVPNAVGIELSIGQNVWVTIPCGLKKFKDMYISGVRGTYEITPTGGEVIIERITNEEIDNIMGTVNI